MARAIDRRCRCPPETFDPPCATGVRKCCGRDQMKSSACAVAAARMASASETSPANSRFERMSPVKSTPFCGT